MTPRQREVLQAVETHGTQRRAAAALGIRPSTLERILQRARRAQARTDPAQHVAGAPAGYHLRGVSTLVRSDGSEVLQWRKTARDASDPETVLRALAEAIEAAEVAARKPSRAPKATREGALLVVPIGDPHFGMLAWPAETGAEWDLKIAAQTHRRALERLFSKASPAEEALIVWMGDNAHADDATGLTPASKHALDTDSRWEKMLGVLFTAMIGSVVTALGRAQRVTVRVVKGNHDPHVAAALALALEAYFRDEPRVHVAREPVPVYVHVWGSVLLAFAHGHAPPPERIPDILAADYRAEIGATEQGYLYTGHKHSKILQERGGLVMEAVQTLAARDAWATHAGYRSARGLFLDCYRKDLIVASERIMVAARDV